MASESHKLSTAEDVGGLLPYLLFWITSVAFLLIEKENKLGRIHAMQSTAIFVPLVAVTYFLGLLPALGRFMTWTLTMSTVALWVYFMYQAGQGTPITLHAIGF